MTSHNNRRENAEKTAPAHLSKLWILPVAFASAVVSAQNIRVLGVDAASGYFGKIASGPTGQTVFRINATDGSVTKVSGAGAITPSSGSRSEILLTCENGTVVTCPNRVEQITILSTGSIGRAIVWPRNFTIAPGAGSPVLGTPSGTATQITFTVTGIQLNSTARIYVGSDITIEADDSGLPSGPTMGFYRVSNFNDDGATYHDGSFRADVYNSISVSRTSHLSFGTVARPRTGSGSIVLSAATGLRTVTGTGAVGLASPTPTRAAFSASGEASRAVAVSIPASFTVTNGGTNITVTTNNSGGGNQTLNSGGTHVFYVGGTMPITAATPTGNYTGTFTVSVNYN